MNSRIDWSSIVADPLHGARLALYVGGTMLIVIFIGRVILPHLPPSIQAVSSIVSTQPEFVAGGLAVQEAVDRWKGVPESVRWHKEFFLLLGAMILNFVVAPALLFRGLNARARRQHGPTPQGSTFRIIAPIVAGWTLILLMVPLAFVGPVTSYRAYRTMQQDHRVAGNRNALLMSLSLMGRKAQVLHIVPPEADGRGGSWKADGGSGPDITLADLSLPESMMARLPDAALLLRTVYLLEVPAKDSLVLWGIGPEINPRDSLFVNKNHERGKVQAHAVITPEKVRAEEDN